MSLDEHFNRIFSNPLRGSREEIMTPPTQSPVEMALEALTAALSGRSVINIYDVPLLTSAQIALSSIKDQQAQPGEKIAPVQGYTPGIPWSLHLEAYDAYCKKYGKQPALIDLEGRNCRGGFGVGELDDFIPGWRDRVSEIGKLRAEVARLSKLVAPVDQQAHGAMPDDVLRDMESVLGDAMSLYPGSRETPDYAVNVAHWFAYGTSGYASPPPSPIPAPSNAQEPASQPEVVAWMTTVRHKLDQGYPELTHGESLKLQDLLLELTRCDIKEPAQEQGRDDVIERKCVVCGNPVPSGRSLSICDAHYAEFKEWQLKEPK